MKRYPKEAAFKKVRKVFEFVWNSPYSSFYRDKYKKAGINLLKDIQSFEDFQKIPFLTREDFVNTDPYDRFYAPIEDFKVYNISSGTTSENRMVLLRSNKLNSRNKKLSQKAVELGVKNCMIFLGPVIYLNVPEVRHKSINRFLANLYNIPATAMLMSKLRVDSIITSPSNLNRLIPHLEKSYDLKKIKYISLGGEYRSKGRLDYYKDKFPNAYFNLKYAATGVGGLGRSCKYLKDKSPQILHPLSHLYYECLNPIQESELVVTHLDTRREIPLIRYKTGDKIKIYEEDCPCGNTTKMKVFGRIGTDVIKIAGIYFYPEPIDDLIFSMSNILDIYNWKLHIFDKDKLPKLEFELILRKDVKDINKAKSTIQKTLTQKLIFDQNNLENLVRLGKISPVEIRFVDSIEYIPPKNLNIIYHK